MKTRLRLVCEADGDCQEDAVVAVSVWHQSPRRPLAVLRLCAQHGHGWITMLRDRSDVDVQVDQGVQEELPLG